MRKKLVLLLILLLLFILFVAVRFFIVGTQDVYGKLKIVSSPDASVFINNVAVGQTPYEDRQKVGEYIIKLIPEKVATDTASWQGKVNIYKNSLSYVSRELGTSDLTSAGEIFTVTKMEKPSPNGPYGEIYVETEPQGAIVYLDNDEKGVAPLVLADVTKGDHELSVFMPGFLRRTQKVNSDPGYRVNAAFKLAIDNKNQFAPTPGPDKEASPEASTQKNTIVVQSTPTGFLRVREEPTIDASESAQVKPGDTFDVLDEKDGWYKINYTLGKSGWISAEYAKKK